MLWQARMQTAHFTKGQISTCRICRICDEYDFGTLSDRGEDRINIDTFIFFFNSDWGGTGTKCLYFIDRKAMLSDDGFITRGKIGLAEKLQQLIRAVAANNIANVQTLIFGNSLS